MSVLWKLGEYQNCDWQLSFQKYNYYSRFTNHSKFSARWFMATNVTVVAAVFTIPAPKNLSRWTLANLFEVLKIICVPVVEELRHLRSTTPRLLLVTKNIENFSIIVLLLWQFAVNTKLFPTYLFTPRSRFLLETLMCFQLVKKFPVFFGTRRFFTPCKSASHLSLSRVSLILSIPPQPIFSRSKLILSPIYARFSQVVSFTQVSTVPFILLFCAPYELHARSFHSSLFHHPNNIRWVVQIIKLFIM